MKKENLPQISTMQDPLTPQSRRFLEGSHLSPSGGTPFSTPLSAPLSPSSALMERLNSIGKTKILRDQPTIDADFLMSFGKRAQNLEENVPTDQSTLRYGMKVHLRFQSCAYLRTCLKTMNSSTKNADWESSSSSSNPNRSMPYVLSNGLGLGHSHEAFILVNANMRDDRGPVRYGDCIALRCVQFQGRYIAADTSSKMIVAKRNQIIGQPEKWVINYPSSHEEDSLKNRTTMSKMSSQTVSNGDAISLRSNLGYYMVFHPEENTSDSIFIRSEAEIPSQTTGCSTTLEITLTTTPYIPLWNRQRPYLTGNFLMDVHLDEKWTRGMTDFKPLAQYPPILQESLLVDDLLYCLLGIEGRYIRIRTTDNAGVPLSSLNEASFILDEKNLNPSIASLAAKFFPLCEKYVYVSDFVEKRCRYEYGLTFHAFCAAVKSLLKEYDIVVAQLEHQFKLGNLTLQKLWFYTQPCSHTLETLYQVCQVAKEVYGGALLTAIQQTASTLGDPKSHEIFLFLTQKASVPYLKMLELWIYHGAIEDHYDEFMVKEDKDYRKEELQEDPWSKYWELRYTLRDDQIPPFLSRIKGKILTTGKYLNVVRMCGREISCSFAGSIEYTSGEREYEERIDQAHHFASGLLLDLIMNENSLMSRLRSLKHYFLMDQGDFFVDFMDIAETELNERADQLSISRLESLLQISLQTSTCASDPYKDDLTCNLSPYNLMHQMDKIHSKDGNPDIMLSGLSMRSNSNLADPQYKAIDAFTLDYKVNWPLSLVISAGALNKYQLIFRHLFFCKHVERRLCDTWLNHQATKELDLRSALGPSYCLRQRMLHFQQNFVYYMMFEVVGRWWHEFETKLVTVSTVDEVLEYHKDFLDNCLKECLLTEPELLKILTKLMTICINFSNQVEMFSRPYSMDEEAIKSEREANRDKRQEKLANAKAERAISEVSGKKKTKLQRRASSMTDMRRIRIKEVSEAVRNDLIGRPGEYERPFIKMTLDAEKTFDHYLSEFMEKLMQRSHLQYNSHLSNLCIRLDYNGFYAK